MSKVPFFYQERVKRLCSVLHQRSSNSLLTSLYSSPSLRPRTVLIGKRTLPQSEFGLMSFTSPTESVLIHVGSVVVKLDHLRPRRLHKIIVNSSDHLRNFDSLLHLFLVSRKKTCKEMCLPSSHIYTVSIIFLSLCEGMKNSIHV